MTQTTSKDQHIPEPIRALMSLSKAAIAQRCWCHTYTEGTTCFYCHQLEAFNRVGEYCQKLKTLIDTISVCPNCKEQNQFTDFFVTCGCRYGDISTNVRKALDKLCDPK